MKRHFISVLGTGNYQETIYYQEDKKFKTAFVQEALLNIKFPELTEDDRITIFLTEDSKKRNWLNRSYTEKEREDAGKELPEMKAGLQEILLPKYGPYLETNLENCLIPVGANEEELWKIFQIIFNQIQPEEELYIDITHALRNIPIQMLAIISYARVVKKATVGGIFYGAFEVGERKNGIVEAPIMELSMFMDLLDWSQAANDFVKYGNSDHIAELYEEQKRKNRNVRTNELNKTIKELQNLTLGLETSRGYYNRQKGANNKDGRSIQESYQQYKQSYAIMQKKDKKIKGDEQRQSDFVLPLGELWEVIDDKINVFDVESNLEIGMASIQWAIDNKRTQQGFTALEETIKTFLCNYYGLDETTKDDRDDICKSISNALLKKIEGKKVKENELMMEHRLEAAEIWVTQKREDDSKKLSEQKIEIAKVIFETIPESLVRLCAEISDCRNSMNHFGYSNLGKFSAKVLNDNLKKYYNVFCDIKNEMENENKKEDIR